MQREGTQRETNRKKIRESIKFKTREPDVVTASLFSYMSFLFFSLFFISTLHISNKYSKSVYRRERTADYNIIVGNHNNKWSERTEQKKDKELTFAWEKAHCPTNICKYITAAARRKKIEPKINKISMHKKRNLHHGTSKKWQGL